MENLILQANSLFIIIFHTVLLTLLRTLKNTVATESEWLVSLTQLLSVYSEIKRFICKKTLVNQLID